MTATALAAVAGGLAGHSVAKALSDLLPSLGRAVPVLERAVQEVEHVLEPLRRAGAEGTSPTDRERLRLQAGAALGALALGAVTLGLPAAFALSLVAAAGSTRAVRLRRARYARRLDSGAAGAAVAIADALAGGHAPRGALIRAPHSLRGPISVELGRVARELQMGAETDAALERLRKRSRSRRVDLIVAAILLQRRSGGGLATLLRDIAASSEDQERLHDEARTASAQARFTSVVVLLMPLGGLALVELAFPGTVGRMLDSIVGIWLVAAAVTLQAAGVMLVHRIGAVQG